MLRGRYLCLFLVVICGFGTSVRADIVTIPDVPSYLWYRGCGPTAAGMIIGYWDAHGYDSLIPGSNDWNTNQQAVKDMIASPGHIRDYVPTPDRVATPEDPYHPDDSVADFNRCSRDPKAYGWSTFYWQDDGLTGYAAYRGYTNFTSSNKPYWDDTFWTWFTAEISAGRPVELLVDTNKDAMSDHFVTGIGYDNTAETPKYACYNAYDHAVHWYDFGMLSSERTYGIDGGVLFDPGPLPGDFNGDGIVDRDDLAIFLGAFDTPDPGDPDMDGDGDCDRDDLAIFLGAFGDEAPAGSVGAAGTLVPQTPLAIETVPEPATVALLGTAALGFAAIGRRRRRGPGGPAAGP